MIKTVNTAWPRPTLSQKAAIKGSSDQDKRKSQVDPISTTPASGSDKAVPNEKKRKAEEIEFLLNKRNKVAGAPFEATPLAKKNSKVPDHATDSETSKTGGTKAISHELPGVSAHITTTITGPKDSVTDQKSHKSSKSTASAEDLFGTSIAPSTKDHVTDSKSGMSKAAGPKLTSIHAKDHATNPPTGKFSVSKAAGPELTSIHTKDHATNPPIEKFSVSKATGPELTSIHTKDHAINPPTGKSSVSKAAGPDLTSIHTKDPATNPPTGKSSASKAACLELPGTIKADITDTNKGKVAGLELSGTSTKRSKTQAGFQEKPEVKKARRDPVGLLNFSRACFANAVTQCLQATAPINDYYRREARGVLPSVANCGVTEGDLRSMGGNTRTTLAKETLVRNAFRQSAEKVALSAYFGQLCDHMSTATEPFISPFLFQQACGTRCKNDDGEPMNGETPEESFQFLTQLLPKLDEEELNSREIWTEKPTVVDEVFGVKTKRDSICEACGHRASHTDKAFWLHAAIPNQEKPLTLEECFSSFENKTRLSDYKCEHCLKVGSTDTLTSIATQDYLILNVNRTDYKLGKIKTRVKVPKGTVHLSAPFSQDSVFEVYGVVQHHGQKHDDGHYTALLKVDDRWWYLNDQKVQRTHDIFFDKLPQAQRGCQFFLRKVSC